MPGSWPGTPGSAATTSNSGSTCNWQARNIQRLTPEARQLRTQLEAATNVIRIGTGSSTEDQTQGRASFFPDCGSFRIFTRKGSVNCQENTRPIRLSSVR